MKKHFLVNPSALTHSLIALLILSCFCFTQSAKAQSHLEDIVESIRSVEQAKQELRESFEDRDRCQVGSCWNTTSTTICELVAALDVQVNGQIVGGMTTVGSSGNIPISEADLKLMKLIFSQCKPTNYQYWNWSMMLHVVYAPSPEADQEIRQGLGLAPKQQP